MQREFVYLKDMLEAAKTILKYADGRTFADFESDGYFRDAVLRQVIVLGEAVHRISHQFEEQHTAIPWPQIISMRNAVVHGYDSIDNRIVWDTIQQDLPQLILSIQTILTDAGLADHI